MPIAVELHSTARRAIYVCAFALFLSGLFVVAKRLTDDAEQPEEPVAGSFEVSQSALLPVVNLLIQDASSEATWSASLAGLLDGQLEVPVASGRVDVLTEVYAIEVDRLDKWHEGIGQAAHYGIETGKQACLALIVDSDLWPLNSETTEKLRIIEKTSLSQGIKLILLRRRWQESDTGS